jgi:phospholipase C
VRCRCSGWPATPADGPEPSGFERERHERVDRREFLKKSALAIAGATLYACTGGGRNRPVTTPTATKAVMSTDTRWPIKRVLYVMPENRSFDNIYGRFPGARGASTGVKFGEEVPLTASPAWLPGDLPHDRAAFLNSVDDGAYDGFATGQFGDPWSYTTFEEQMVPVYWQYARDYVLSDNFFSSVGGPSHPNHLFFVAGQSGGVIDNPENIEARWEPGARYPFKSWGCDAVGKDVFVFVKDDEGNLTKHDTCFDFPTVPQQLESIGVSWAFYSASPTQSGYFWNALNAISGVFHADLWRPEHIRPVDRIVQDIREDKLPAVTWVTPRFELSGHPPESTCFSQNWLAGIVDAVMESDAWRHTAVFVAWDMWGGLYDHVVPRVVDEVGHGFRVPSLVLSPFAKRGYVDDAEADHCAPLKFVEDNWGLSYLTDRIVGSHNYEHVFDFDRKPRTDARPSPKIASCYGSPWRYPGDDYPGWPPGTDPDETFFVHPKT